MKGYWGKVVVADLTKRKIEIIEPGNDIYRDFLGGIGLGIWYLYENIPQNADPLGPENILGFLPGLLNGSGIPFSSRYTVVAKSPLTNTWGDANAGGFFGFRFKKSGFDGLFVKGISNTPVYIYIDEEIQEIRDAHEYWGKSALETERKLKEKLGKNAGVASIGVPGEKKSLISCIMNDHSRAAARSGLGAVMGSKLLKAVVVKGSKKINMKDSEGVKVLNGNFRNGMNNLKISKGFNFFTKISAPILPKLLKSGASGVAPLGNMLELFKEMGTTMSAGAQSQMGDSPVKNWKGVGYRDFPMISHSNELSDIALEPFKEAKYSCASCPIGCGAVMSLPNSKYDLKDTHRPEYESIAAFGSVLLNKDLETMLYANEICNAQGIDTISAGSVIAFAMECYEKGLITQEETGGIDLTWGNSEAIIKTLEKIVLREGVGEILADGSKYAAENIGKGSESFAMHVRGQDLAMHDPRLNPGWGATYITDPTPGRHTPGGTALYEIKMPLLVPEGVKIKKMKRYQYTGKGKTAKVILELQLIYNAIGICSFSGWTGQIIPIANYLNQFAGWNYTPETVLKTGERIMNLRQSFNVRDGITPADFKIPQRAVGKPPLESGPTKGMTVDLETMREDTFNAMDWDIVSGKPHRGKLESLGLHKVMKDLYSDQD